MNQLFLSQGLIEYMMSASVLLAFAFTLAFGYLSRKSFALEMKELKVKKRDIAAALLIVALFISVEVAVVKPTQQLFFDDAIYQGMALDLIHTGQAWMCNYGGPTSCISGQIFHEPIGESFNIAIAFLLLGVHRYSTYIANLALSAVAVFLTFFVALFLLRDKTASLFSELVFALTPMLLVWAVPTTSDIPMLTYALLAIFAMLLFTKKKNAYTFGFMLSSMALLLYMKVDAGLFIPLIIVSYIILDNKNIVASVRSNAKLLKRNMLNTKLLLILLLFVLLASTEVMYVAYEIPNSSFGASKSSPVNVEQSCGTGYTVADGKFSVQYFRANICANIVFWFNALKSDQLVQPAIFTIIGILGLLIMCVRKNTRRIALFLGLWFLSFFLIYTSFYAGGVDYGVDWRFMLSVIPPVAIFGGYFLATLTGFVEHLGKHMESFRAKIRSMGHSSKKRRKRTAKAARTGKAHNDKVMFLLGVFISVLLLAYPAYQSFPIIGVPPSEIQQAGGARFYENFVYNYSSSIPRGCIVLSFDPEYFNLQGLNGSQMSYYSNGTVNGRTYKCVVIDYGYWCYAGYSSTCSGLLNSSNTQVLASSTYTNGPEVAKFAFYRIISQKD